jgi:hypothetical protein
VAGVATLERLIVDAVQDMIVQSCVISGIEPERSTMILFTACGSLSILLGHARAEVLDTNCLADIIAIPLCRIEEVCFDRAVDEGQITMAAERAIAMLYLATKHYGGFTFYPFSLN